MHSDTKVLRVEISPGEETQAGIVLLNATGESLGESEKTQKNSAPAKNNNRSHNSKSFNNGGRAKPTASLDTLARLLSARNVGLLKLIKKARPRSVAELSRLSGRPKASLTATLHRLEEFGIVTFEEIDGRRRAPVVVCDILRLEVAINASDQTSSESVRTDS